MKSINNVALLGNLATDPETHTTANGNTVASFSIATDFHWKTKEGVDKKNTDFHRVTAWMKLAEICAKYLKKGSAVYVTGRLSNHTYNDKEGAKRYITEVVAEDVSILSWKKTDTGSEMDIEKVQKGADEEEMLLKAK